jgi:putative spermidine/putrescine transport system substrate-binding protein
MFNYCHYFSLKTAFKKEVVKMKKKMSFVLSLFIFLFLLAIFAGSVIAKEVLTVARYGGDWGKMIDDHVARPFEKKYGVKVVVDPGASTVTLAKLRQQKGNPVIDVAWMDSGISEIALSQGLVDWIDPSKLTNMKETAPESFYKTKDGKIFAVGAGFYSVGIAYNEEEVKSKPKSWFDLWKKEFEGRVTVPGTENSTGIPFLVTMAKIRGGGTDNIDPGLEAIANLKVAAFFKSMGIASNMFETEEVVIAALFSNNAWALKDKGLPIAYVVPKEGTVGLDLRAHIAKGSKHKDLAEKFIDFALSRQAQKGFAEMMYVGPVNKHVVLSEKAKKRMPWGYGGSVADLNFFDWEVLRDNRQEWVELWNKKVIGK